MKFKNIEIKNFRNFEQIQIGLENKNVLFGLNDIGKTNFLYEIIQQLPINYFEYHMVVELQPNNLITTHANSFFKKLYDIRRQNSIIWFLNFVYRLRNSLFHEIIDPLNEEWQIVFKNAYLVLKEIVDLNIQIIDDKKEASQRCQ